MVTTYAPDTSMKIICVEEHATDPATDKAARPAVLREAPYFGLIDSPDAVSRPRNDHWPMMVALPEALELAADLGAGRIKHMGEQGIQMQLVSYGSLAQLAPAGQAVALTQTANNRLAEAVAANPARLSGFAVLPRQDPSSAPRAWCWRHSCGGSTRNVASARIGSVTRALGAGHRAAAEQAFTHGYQVAVLTAGLGLIAAAIIAAFGLRDDRRRELDAAAGKPAPSGDPDNPTIVAQPYHIFVIRPDGGHNHVNH